VTAGDLFRRPDQTRALGVGVHNALTAALAETAGFDVLWLSSFELSTTFLLPDANLITLTEVGRLARDVCQASSLPLIVDADNGYGSDESALRALREFSSAGAAAMCLEDARYPKRCSFYTSVERDLEPVEDFCRRIERLVQRAGDVKIVARTEGLVGGLGFHATSDRIRRYIDAGSDAVFVQTGAATVPEFNAILSTFKGHVPLVVTPTALPDTTASELHERGANIVIYANLAIRGVVKVVSDLFATVVQRQSLGAVEDAIVPMETIFELTKADEWIAPRR
jgi:2-methylisocitrate lyase-like PEP mutase family enzyme